MSHLSRSQILVYGAVAVALLLLGARWIRSADEHGSPAGEVSFAETAEGGGGPIEGASGRDVVVHVAGAVREPGVYRLPTGSRVTDAVDRAGGAIGGAGVDGINLAAVLADGQQVVVPGRAASGAATASGAAASDGPISLGSATLEELDTIEGIGPVTAQNILDHREQQGGVSSVDDLDQISGIGPATMESLRSALQP
ncbi:MAG: helix-hairpin-helix domain-containing protein [Solirubrobacterales bacterium]